MTFNKEEDEAWKKLIGDYDEQLALKQQRRWFEQMYGTGITFKLSKRRLNSMEDFSKEDRKKMMVKISKAMEERMETYDAGDLTLQLASLQIHDHHEKENEEKKEKCMRTFLLEEINELFNVLKNKVSELDTFYNKPKGD